MSTAGDLLREAADIVEGARADDYLGRLIIIAIVLSFASSFIGASIEGFFMRGQAFEHHAAFYDPYTGAFTWRENNE